MISLKAMRRTLQAGSFLIVSIIALSFADGTKTLISGDGKSNRLNMVFLAEGYTQAQQTKFIADVRTDINKFFLCKPWSYYKNYCSVYGIGVVSVDSGADHPAQGITRNTYFEATFGAGSLERLVVLKNESKVAPLLAQHVPDYDFVCILVNDTEYGGSGGAYALATLNSESAYLILHESGHSFANLADEYSDAAQQPYEAKNATAKTQRDQIRWNVWIAAATPLPTPATSQYYSVVGLFEGAVYSATGWYRPKYDCTMRTAGNLVFCEVCREEVITGIYSRISAIDSSFPSNASTIQNQAGLVLFARPMKPDSSILIRQWIVNGQAVPTTSDTLALGAVGLKQGLNTVTVRVSDTTNMVRIAANKPILNDSIVWRVDNTLMESAKEQSGSLVRMIVDFSAMATGLQIRYVLPQSQTVRLMLHDMRGRLRYEMKDVVQIQGKHELMLRSQELGIGRGVYLVRLCTAGFTAAHLIDFVK